MLLFARRQCGVVQHFLPSLQLLQFHQPRFMDFAISVPKDCTGDPVAWHGRYRAHSRARTRRSGRWNAVMAGCAARYTGIAPSSAGQTDPAERSSALGQTGEGDHPPKQTLVTATYHTVQSMESGSSTSVALHKHAIRSTQSIRFVQVASLF